MDCDKNTFVGYFEATLRFKLNQKEFDAFL